MFEDFFSSIREIVSKVLPMLSKVLPPAIQEIVIVLRVLANIVEAVAEALGLGGQKIDDIGNRAIQAEDAGYRPEDFNKYEDYVQFIKEFDLDPERSEKIPDEAKLAYGIKVIIEQIDNRFSVDFADFLPEIWQDPEFFNTERVTALLQSFVKADIAIHDLSDYLDSKLNGTKTGLVEDAVLEAEKKLAINECKTDGEIRESIQEKRR